MTDQPPRMNTFGARTDLLSVRRRTFQLKNSWDSISVKVPRKYVLSDMCCHIIVMKV